MSDRQRFKLPAVDTSAGILMLGVLLAGLGWFLPLQLRWITTPLVFFVPGNAIVSAIFGRQLEFGGVRRVGLCGVMSLVSYSVMALAVFGLGFTMSQGSVVLSVLVLSVLAAAVVEFRTRSWPAFAVPRHAAYARSISMSEVAIPALAMAAALIVAYGSVKVLPRKPADEYSAIAFDGTWALTNRVVRVDATLDVQVQYQVLNRTRTTQTYLVTTGIEEDTQWGSDVITIEPGADYHGSATGKVTEGSCSSRLEVLLEQVGSEQTRDPLVLYFRDTNGDC